MVIEFIIKNVPNQKIVALDNVTPEFYQTFQEEWTPIILKHFLQILNLL
jgi:hypothetical protein